MKHLTPLKAIREYCLWCSNNQRNEIRHCPSLTCPFYYFCFGRKANKGSRLKAIKVNCKECQSLPKKCDFEQCSLYLYRTGHNPKRRFIGRFRADKSLKTPIVMNNQKII